MSASVSLLNKNLEEMSESESISDSENDDCSPDRSIVGERLRGDGQEQDVALNKKIDDDEDRRNPQYIPKRGNFYEHDDRTLEDDDSLENNDSENGEKEKDTPRYRKKVWEENDGEKWGHDLYIEKEQQPKTKQELINAYGYDIRNEDGPPRARRRRRYGRGPNKYTRNWEDEEAYSRATHNKPRKSQKAVPTQEDFPPLNVSNNDRNQRAHSVSPVRSQKKSSSSKKKDRFAAATKTTAADKAWKQQSIKHFDDPIMYQENKPISNQQVKTPSSEKQQKSQKSSKKKDDDAKAHHTSSKSTKQMAVQSSGNGSVGTKSSKLKEDIQIQTTKIQPITSQSFSNSNRSKQNPMSSTTIGQSEASDCEIYETMKNINYRNNAVIEQQMAVNNRQASVPPRLQQAEQQQRMGPKRYSSLRQRSLPETTPPQAQFTQINSTAYYQQEFTPQTQSTTDGHSLHHQISPNTQQSLLLNQMSSQQQLLNVAQTAVSTQQTMGFANAAQVRAATTGATQPSAQNQHQLSMIAAAVHVQQAQPQQVNAQLLNAAGQPIITHAAPHQQILTPPQGLSPQTHQAMLNAQSQQLLTAQTHPQYGAPPPTQYQVPPPTAGSASAVYNLQQTVSAGSTTAYITQQPAAVINTVYGTGPPPGAQPPPPQYTPSPFSAYQPAYNTPPGQTTQDLYQSQSGITYYSPHNQPAAPRAPLKRPKAAIPILAPPERTNTAVSRGRGRTSPLSNNVGGGDSASSTETNKTEQPIQAGRGRISPSELNNDNNYISRGRGRKMSNENLEFDSSTTVTEKLSNLDLKCVENAVDDNTQLPTAVHVNNSTKSTENVESFCSDDQSVSTSTNTDSNLQGIVPQNTSSSEQYTTHDQQVSST